MNQLFVRLTLVVSRLAADFSVWLGRQPRKMNNPAPPEAVDYDYQPTSLCNYDLIVPYGAVKLRITAFPRVE